MTYSAFYFICPAGTFYSKSARALWRAPGLLPVLLYALDLFGVAVFFSGAWRASVRNLDLLGIVVLIDHGRGGGTLRDVLLGRYPIFWIRTPARSTILAAVTATLVWVHFLPIPMDALLIADAVGLGLFAISGAQVAEKGRLPAPG